MTGWVWFGMMVVIGIICYNGGQKDARSEAKSDLDSAYRQGYADGLNAQEDRQDFDYER